MNMKEKNAKKSKIHQLGFSFLKRESNYLDRQRQAILVCFSVMLSLGILSNILGFSGAFDPFFTVSNIVFLIVVLSSFMAYLFGKIPMVRQSFVSLSPPSALLEPISSTVPLCLR